MDSYQQPDSTIVEPPPPPPGIFGTRIPTATAFVVGILLFLLPFAELKCKGFDESNSTIFSSKQSSFSLTNTGMGLAFGKQWKFNMPGMGNLFNDDSSLNKKYSRSTKSNAYAVVALILGLIGLGFAFINVKSGALANMITGILAAGALIGLMVDLKKKMNEDILEGASQLTKASDKMPLVLAFTPWFYITIIAFLAAAFFSYKRMQTMR